MFFRFFFSRMTLQKQVDCVRRKGIMLGTRQKDGRRMHIYMVNELFVEILFKGDDIENNAETLSILRGLDTLNEYLEKEFKASF